MARSDLLLTLVKSGTKGDPALFRRTVEALVAEERAKQHHVLADRLEENLHTNGTKPSLAGGGMQSMADLVSEVMPSRQLTDLVLADDIVEECRLLVEEHHRADLLRSHGLEPRHRVMFAGPPGNGKTSLAEAIACEIGVPLYVLRYDGTIGSFLGETAARLRRVFDFVRTRPCVLFLDEFDTLGKERGDPHETGEIKRVVSSLLLQIDSLPSYVIVVTATNHPELLDRAVWRRFELRLVLPKPTEEQIEKLLDLFCERLRLTLDGSRKRLLSVLAGASFSEIQDVMFDIARRVALSEPGKDARPIVSAVAKRWEKRLTP